MFSGLVGIIAIVLVAAFVVFCVTAAKKHKYHVGKTIGSNVALLVVAAIVFRYAFPWAASMLFYQGMLMHLGHSMFVLAGLGIAVYAFALHDQEQKTSLAVTYGIVAALVMIGGPLLMGSFTEWQIAREYAFTKRDGMVEIDKGSIRFTPLHVAYNSMVQKVGSSESTLDLEHTKPADVNGHTGFMAPITPSGLVQTFTGENDGFMFYDDGANVAKDESVHRSKQPFQVGEEMEWLDNIWRALYQRNPWCEYPDIFYVHSNTDEKTDHFIGVAPRISYKLRFPLVWVPYWSGVTLFTDDGKFEDLSVEDARKDPRLQGKRIFPESLDRTIVDAQRYDQGVTSGWFRRPGLIRLPELPGENKQPFLVKEGDGNWYYMTVTEPSGSAYALFRIYYIDAHSGERTMCEFDPNDGLVGPEKAIDYVKALPGYKWVEKSHEGKEDGNFRIVEPIPVPMNQRLYWKYTITTNNYVGVVATAVVDAKSYDLKTFANRNEFEAWLNGKEIKPSGAAPASAVLPEGAGNQAVVQEIEEMQKLLQQMSERLDRLHQQVSPLPK